MTNPNDVAGVLERAALRLSKPGAWTQHGFAMRDGVSVGWQSPVADCWCILGAVGEEDRPGLLCSQSPAVLFLTEKVFALPDWSDVSAWNDTKGRTKSQVVAKLRQAAQLAREQANG